MPSRARYFVEHSLGCPDWRPATCSIRTRSSAWLESHDTATPLAQRVDVEILITHVQVDELVRVNDPEAIVRRMLALLRVRARLVTTSVFVLDVSRWDLGRLGRDEDNAAFRRHIGVGSARNVHAEDAVIAGAARAENATLVTLNRQDLNRFRRGQPDLPILGWAEFLAELLI